MTMLADRIDAVIGVDTHTDTHTAAILDTRGGVLDALEVSTDEEGFAALLDAATAHAPGGQVAWAIEGTGSYGATLAQTLIDLGQEVLEVSTPRRERGASKNDINDAIAIARTALARGEHARPRTGQVRGQLRLITTARAADVRTRTRLSNQLKATILSAPPSVRAKLRALPTAAQVSTAARMRTRNNDDALTRTTIEVLRATARQIQDLNKRIAWADERVDTLTSDHAPAIRAEPGAGPISTAQILITHSHPGRFHSEAAFAATAGTSPLEASSGRTVRHRLNRTGDRQLNAAIHRIVHTRRLRKDPATCAYIERRRAQGKSDKEIERCLKRYVTRHIYRLLQTMPALP